MYAILASLLAISAMMEVHARLVDMVWVLVNKKMNVFHVLLTVRNAMMKNVLAASSPIMQMILDNARNVLRDV